MAELQIDVFRTGQRRSFSLLESPERPPSERGVRIYWPEFNLAPWIKTGVDKYAESGNPFCTQSYEAGEGRARGGQGKIEIGDKRDGERTRA